VRLGAELLLDLVAEGASRLVLNLDFTPPCPVRDLLKQWTTGSDPVRAQTAERVEVTRSGY
jgi:hypothetical protein